MAADPKKPSKSVKVLKFTQNILAVLVFAAILFSIAGKIFFKNEEYYYLCFKY